MGKGFDDDDVLFACECLSGVMVVQPQTFVHKAVMKIFDFIKRTAKISLAVWQIPEHSLVLALIANWKQPQFLIREKKT